MRVLKFGGTSMNDEQTWHHILSIIKDYSSPIVVVSATAHTTRQLIAAAETAPCHMQKARNIAADICERHTTIIQNFLAAQNSTSNRTLRRCEQWIDECIKRLHHLLDQIDNQGKLTPRLRDAVASIGEQLSAYLFAECGQLYGLPTKWVDASKIIKTDDSFGRANPDRKQIAKNIETLTSQVKQGNIPVMGGFYGSSKNGLITTLGFEGSDYTASLIGAELSAKAIEIWTDVSGIYTCDPRVVSKARPIPEMSFQEATELAYFGAKVLHPSTMRPAESAGIPIMVKNIFEANQPGTKIHNHQNNRRWAKAMTFLKDVSIVTVTSDHSQAGPRFLAEIFSILKRNGVAVNAVTTTEAAVSVAIQHHDYTDKLEAAMNKLGGAQITNNQGLISIIGCAFDQEGSMRSKLFGLIDELSLSLMSYSKSKQNLNIALPETQLIPAVRRIHRKLFSQENV